MTMRWKGKIVRAAAALVVAAVATGCGGNIAKKKEDASVHYRLGVIHLNDGNLIEAMKELTVSVETYGEDPAAHNALGLAYFAKGLIPEATLRMKEAIRLDENYSEARVNLAAIYLAEKNWDGAAAESRKALSNIFYRTPEKAHHNIGMALYNKGDYPGAIESFRKAVELNPLYPERPISYYHMGLSYEKTGSVKEAAAALENAVKGAPGYVDAYFSLGMAYVKMKNKSGAALAFERVIKLAPDGVQAKGAREYLDLIK